MRVLLAGAGLIGRRHLEHLNAHPRLDLVGVIDPERIDINLPTFNQIDDVNVQADAIIIATPTHLHVEHALKAAARSWHMLIEKPIARDLDEAAKIIVAAEDAGSRILVGHHRRHHASVIALKELLDEGRIGAPVAVSLIWSVRKPDDYFAGTWRQGRDGSPVMINLIHEIDTLRFLFGDIISVVGIPGVEHRKAARVESGAVALGFDSGMTATISFSDVAPSPWSFEAATGENPNIAASAQDNLKIMGTRGAISFPSLRVWHGSQSWSEAQDVVQENDAANIPLVAQLDHFADVISGEAHPVVDARDAAASLEIALEIEEIMTQSD